MSVPTSAEWLELTPDEFFERRDACPVCYMPYGYPEAHGVYNPLGVDFYISTAVVRRAASHGGIIAPPFAWHIDEEPAFNWGIDSCGMGEQVVAAIPCDLFLHNVLYHIRAMDARGFRAAALITGHCVPGLDEDVRLLIDYYRRRTGTPMQIVWEVAYDGPLAPEKLPEHDTHAGTVETSIAWALHPELAHPERLGKPARRAFEGGGNEAFDAFCAPKGFPEAEKWTVPSVEYGRYCTERAGDKLAELARRLLASYDDTRPRPAAPDFNRTAELWASFVRITSRYWRSTMTVGQYDRHESHPAFPGWDVFGVEDAAGPRRNG
ncbi:MAG: creatininase family protein [Eubacteriales bacterium]|nr:creatininase family protein [Eubacteriales bacterium]